MYHCLLGLGCAHLHVPSFSVPSIHIPPWSGNILQKDGCCLFITSTPDSQSSLLAAQVLDRLKASSAYVELAKQPATTKAAETRLAKAAAKLDRTPVLAVLKEQLEAGLAGEQDKGTAAAAASAKKEQQAKVSAATSVDVVQCLVWY